MYGRVKAYRVRKSDYGELNKADAMAALAERKQGLEHIKKAKDEGERGKEEGSSCCRRTAWYCRTATACWCRRSCRRIERAPRRPVAASAALTQSRA